MNKRPAVNPTRDHPFSFSMYARRGEGGWQKTYEVQWVYAKSAQPRRGEFSIPSGLPHGIVHSKPYGITTYGMTLFLHTGRG